MKIKIYTTPWCSYCEPYIELVKELVEGKLELEVIDASKLSDDEIARIGIYSVPLTIIEDNKKEIDRWNGTSIKKLEYYCELD